MTADRMSPIGRSKFWELLWSIYGEAPSIALCRVPELEYASALSVKDIHVLDHCCGDGIFAGLAWPGMTLAAGCDCDTAALARARKCGMYAQLDNCDVTEHLPYPDGVFDLVFNNSALEHISCLDAALREVARVTASGGVFAFNVLNHRFFEWWPPDAGSAEDYREWQPFIHALPLVQWQAHLQRAGFEIESVQGYFDRRASAMQARLDCAFSGAFMRKRRSRFVEWYNRMPLVMQQFWKWRLSLLSWQTEADQGAGYFIKAVRRG